MRIFRRKSTSELDLLTGKFETHRHALPTGWHGRPEEILELRPLLIEWDSYNAGLVSSLINSIKGATLERPKLARLQFRPEPELGAKIDSLLSRYPEHSDLLIACKKEYGEMAEMIQLATQINRWYTPFNISEWLADLRKTSSSTDGEIDLLVSKFAAMVPFPTDWPDDPEKIKSVMEWLQEDLMWWTDSIDRLVFRVIEGKKARIWHGRFSTNPRLGRKIDSLHARYPQHSDFFLDCKKYYSERLEIIELASRINRRR